MGCAPFANHHFQMGVTVMGFAEDLGHRWTNSLNPIMTPRPNSKVIELLLKAELLLSRVARDYYFIASLTVIDGTYLKWRLSTGDGSV